MKDEEKSQNTVIKKSSYHPNYKVITEHDVKVLDAVLKRDGVRFQAAEDLGMTERAIVALLSRVRLKLDGANKARRKYSKILKRRT